MNMPSLNAHSIFLLFFIGCLGAQPVHGFGKRAQIVLCSDAKALDTEFATRLLPENGARKFHPSRGNIEPIFDTEYRVLHIKKYYIAFVSGYDIGSIESCVEKFPDYKGEPAPSLMQKMSRGRVPIGSSLMPAFPGPPGGFSMTRYFPDQSTEVYLNLHGEQDAREKMFMQLFSCSNGSKANCQ